MIQKQILAVLNRYGRQVTLQHAESLYSFPAYIAPYTYPNRQFLDETYSQLGTGDPGFFHYIGSVEDGGQLLCVGDFLTDCEERFVVSTCGLIRLGNTPVCMWGMLKKAYSEVVS